jgi:hypothetical protein
MFTIRNCNHSNGIKVAQEVIAITGKLLGEGRKQEKLFTIIRWEKCGAIIRVLTADEFKAV